MELPSMRVRNPVTDSGRGGVTAGSAQPTSSSVVGGCHVNFTDLSGAGGYTASHRSDVEGFQQRPAEQQQQQHQQYPLPSQQHLNPLFDVPDSSHSSADNGRDKTSPLDGPSSAESGAASRSAFTAIPLALSEKPSLSKRQSTKQLLKPKNALEVEVGSRDTMEKIAIRFRTTPSEICKMNKMASRMIFPGQILFVPDPDASPVTPSPTKEHAGGAIDVMFPAVAAAADDARRNNNSGNNSNKNNSHVGDSDHHNDDGPKMPSLPSLPSFTSVTTITSGVSEASKDAGAAASSQFSSLISKLNPATAISRTSLRKKKSNSEEKKNGSGGNDNAVDSDPDQECLERFLKLNAKHITDGRGVVSGTLLVTPNAIMFDPHVMDPLVVEHSAEEYGMMVPMECVMSATLYHDISRMSLEGMQRKESCLCTPAYHGETSDRSGAATPEAEAASSMAPTLLAAVPPLLAEMTTEQRLSVALGEKSASATPKSGRRTPLHAASSKESSGSHEKGSSSSNQHLVGSDGSTAATAPPELDDSVFEASTKTTPSKVFSGVETDVNQIIEITTSSSSLAPTTTTATTTPPAQSSNNSANTRTEVAGESKQTCIRAPNGGAASANRNSMVDSAGHLVTAGSTVWYADLSTSPATDAAAEILVASSSSTSDSSSSTAVCVENAVDPRMTEHLFAPIQIVILPGQKNVDNVTSSSSPGATQLQPLFLCLKVGQPLNKRVANSGPIASYAKKKKRPEYWFSIPKDRASRLYAFFLQWTPEVYDNKDVEGYQQAFVVNGNVNDNHDDEDDFAKQLNISKEWEIVNTDEIERRRSILASEDCGLPELIGESAIFDEDSVKKLHAVLPARAVGYPWTLVFSTEDNGFSLNSLYRKMAATPQGPVLMFIKDTDDKVFGAMSSCTFIVSDHFYGNGEMFLFSFNEDEEENGGVGELKHWPWSGENSYFIKGNKESLAIGAGEGVFGLWLDEDLYHGRSHPCSTFANECLSSKEDFVIKVLEIWAFLS